MINLTQQFKQRFQQGLEAWIRKHIIDFDPYDEVGEMAVVQSEEVVELPVEPRRGELGLKVVEC